jgi:orotate phosphoribosyltransferase-like protein
MIDVKELLEKARENPWWQFEGEEIAKMLNISANTITMLKRAKDSPFCAGKSRPEWVFKFLETHPEWSPTSDK